MTISVLVPIYNLKLFLPQCIESILNQTFADFELLLIDDGSTDGSGELCDRYAVQDGRICVIHQQNAGLSIARNTGIEQAKGEFLAPVDADDWLEPDYLATLHQLCIEKQVPVAACNHWLNHKDNQSAAYPTERKEVVWDSHEVLHRLLYHHAPDVSVWGKLYHHSIFQSIRYPRKKLFEDTYCIAEIILTAQRIAYTPKPLYHYRIRNNSISRGMYFANQLQFLDAVDHMTDVVQKYFPEEKRGCIRRRTHAAMSIRRHLVGCKPEEKMIRHMLDENAKSNIWLVLSDSEAPMRDKIALLALWLGPWIFDHLWTWYEKNRSDR